MTIPSIQYYGRTGEKSIGFGSPETLTSDLNNIANMFNPAAANGGISSENLRPNSVGDVAVGNLTPNDNISTVFTGTGSLSVVLSYISKSIRGITGGESWLTSPIDTIIGLSNKTSVNMQVIDDLDNNTYKKIQIYNKSEVDNKVFGTNNIANASITISKLDPNILTVVGEAQEAAMLIDHDNRINTLENEIIHRAVTVTGTNNYILTCQPTITSYTDLLGIVMTCPTNSTGAVRVNVDGKGVANVLKSNGTAVTNFKANGVYSLHFHNGNFILQGEGGYGSAISSQVLDGVPFTNETGEELTGNIPIKTGDNSALSSSVSGTTLKLTVPTGYYDGNAKVTHTDNNRIPSNIKLGVSIDGVIGTMPDGTGKRKRAFGQLIADNSTPTLTRYDGTTTPWYTIVVSGLDFTPTSIQITNEGGYVTQYSSNLNLYAGYGANIVISSNYGGGNTHLWKTISPLYVVYGGFRLPVDYGGGWLYKWEAYE